MKPEEEPKLHDWEAKWAFTRSDRRTDRSVRLVCPTGRSDDRIV